MLSDYGMQRKDLLGLGQLVRDVNSWVSLKSRIISSEANIPRNEKEMSAITDNFLGMENLQGFEGLSALEESAVRLHEIYKSLMAGGFNEDEALSLIAKMTKPNS